MCSFRRPGWDTYGHGLYAHLFEIICNKVQKVPSLAEEHRVSRYLWGPKKKKPGKLHL